MPLCDDAVSLIRTNLKQIEAGHKVAMITIGKLTPEQLADINRYRAHRRMSPSLLR